MLESLFQISKMSFGERFGLYAALVAAIAAMLWSIISYAFESRAELRKTIYRSGERMIERIEAFDRYITDTDDDSGIADWADMEKAAQTRLTNGRYRG